MAKQTRRSITSETSKLIRITGVFLSETEYRILYNSWFLLKMVMDGHFHFHLSLKTHDKQERMQNDGRMWGGVTPIPIQLVFKELLLSKSNCPRIQQPVPNY